MGKLEKPLNIWARRYIGNKAKLANWIMEVILANTCGTSFCDLFSGTGVIANTAFPYYDSIIINDFLYSNNVIHRAFFGEGTFDKKKINCIIKKYNEIDGSKIADNYFSINFGGKYFSVETARCIGQIRQDIDDKKNLTHKERDILLTILLYAVDRVANTVGHFDAYLKKGIKSRPMRLYPINAQINPTVTIFRRDANEIVNEINADIFYIDPPYNSRQYSRFYHIYENLIKWDKPPLYGVALKPKPENMSRYCTKQALTAFRDLVDKIDAKWLAVSYNNTYTSKSASSRNRISLEDLETVLKKRGRIKVFSTPYSPFTTGKTDFANHMEYLFIVDIEKRG